MIYLDHASTTPLHPQVKESYHKLIDESFANADSIYDLGFKVKNQLNQYFKIERMVGCGQKKKNYIENM